MLNRKLQGYLRRVCARIKSPVSRREIYRELRAHLLDRLENLSQPNVGEDQVIQKILDEAEDPKELGRKLSDARKPFILRHPILSGSFFLAVTCALILVVAAHLVVGEIMDSSDLTSFENREAYLVAFESDLKFLDKSLLEKDWQRTRNAQGYIASHLSRYDKKYTEKLRALLKGQSLVEQDEAYRFAVSEGRSLVWLDGLREFDFWNFSPILKLFIALKRPRSRAASKRSGSGLLWICPSMSSCGPLLR